MNERKRSRFATVLATGLLALVPAVAQAFDHLEISVINPEIVDGRPSVTIYEQFSVLVRAVNADGTTDTAADYIRAALSSPDVAANMPESAYLQNGEHIFAGIDFLDDGQPVRLRVADQDDGSVPFAQVELNCYNFVHHFEFGVPAGDKYVGQAVTLTVTARDFLNAAVRNFDDDVVLTPALGHFTAGPSITVSGGSFTFGVATVAVVFQGTDPSLQQNTVNALNTVVYPTQAAAAAGSGLVAPLYPGALSRVVLLLPGQTLTPGVSPGRSGTAIAQISGFPFTGIDVYATDQYWNPVAGAPFPTLAWSANDAAPGVSLPAGGAMSSNTVQDQSATLMTSGLRQVTVTASGAISTSSSANVQVNPAGLHHFSFDYAVLDTNAVQATTTPFQIRVRAYDSFNNVFPYNGPVSMRVRIGAGDESADYLIATSNNFVAGVLNASVQVTKRAFSARLIVDSNTGVVTLSGDFQVNAGPMEKVLFTLPGQTWTPGLNDPAFGGNIGLPTPIVAGQMVEPLEIRAVDRYGNLVSGARTVAVTCPTGHLLLLDGGGSLIESGVITLNGTGVYSALMATHGDQLLQAGVGGQADSFSSPLRVSPNTYQRLMVIAPGETLDAGTIYAPGKIGIPSPQDAGSPFNVQVIATDYYYNPIGAVSPFLPIQLVFTSTDPQATLPAAPQSLQTGTGVFQVTLETLADPNQQLVTATDPVSSRTASALIPVEAGVIDHFEIGVNDGNNPDPTDILEPVPDHQAGAWLPNLTVIARDAYGNHIRTYTDSVSLSLNVGGDVLSPLRISLADGFGTGVYQGVWRGSLRITRADRGITVSAVDDVYGRSGVSNPFDVLPGAYVGLQVLLPGETATPGEAPGKFGDPLPVVAGAAATAAVTALDAWWNPTPASPIVRVSSSSYADLISANDMPLEPDGSTDFALSFRTATAQTLRVRDLALSARRDSSLATVTPDAFTRLQAIAPGETPNPGGPEVDGKTGAPAVQTATLQFPLTVHAVDRFWNRVDNGFHNIHLGSDEGSLVPGNPLNNGQALAAGEIVFPVALSSLGYVTLTAYDLTDAGILGHDVVVQVAAGAQYRITTPDTALVGPPSSFAMTVELVDEAGTVMTNAYNQVTLRALTPTLQPAPGVLLVTDAQLTAGVVAIPTQGYDVASRIVIEVSDTSGRLGYSDIIRMDPNGLWYDVTVGTTPLPVAGPPAAFPVTVRLRDTETGSLVDDDRFFSVAIVDNAGALGAGAVGITSRRLVDGQVSFQQTYTQAGEFAVRAFDPSGLAGDSPLFTVRPAGYQRLQLLAPGETARPGAAAFAATGKSALPDTQRSGEPFPLAVRAVDQYWNPIGDESSGRIHLATTDGSFSWPDNPDPQDAPFFLGGRAVDAFLVAEGEVGVTVSDLDAPQLPGQTVEVPVRRPYVYEVTVPAAAQTGGMPGFAMTVRLLDPDTGDPVAGADHRVVLTPLQAGFAPGSGVLGTAEVYLVNGVSFISDQSYSALEDLRVRVSDDFGRQATSGIVTMQTGGLYYDVAAPANATVGGPATFPLSIDLIDSNTGERVAAHSGLIQISVLSAATAEAGGGVLGTVQQMLVGGHADVQQTYTLAEEVYFRVLDGDGNEGFSNSCRLAADGFKQLQIVAPGETPEPGAEAGTGKTGAPVVQTAGEPFVVELRAVDQFFNPVTSLDGGALELDCSEPDLFAWQNPADYHAPFVGGRRQVGVVLDGAGNLTLNADDTQHPEAGQGHVTIPVAEAVYEVSVPDTTFVGPPSRFAVGVRLVNPASGATVPAGNRISLEALRYDFGSPDGQLGITEWTLLQGAADIATQSYGVSERIIIRVSDERGRTTDSAVVTVIPVGVTYAVTAPDTVVAGEPWPLSVTRVDVTTGRLVTGYDETFSISAINAWSGAVRPDPSLVPAGVLRFTYGATVEGRAQLEDQAYDRAESIYLRVTDAAGGDVLSRLITVLAAPAQFFTLSLHETDGSPFDRVLRPDQQIRVRVAARDEGGNPAPRAAASFEIRAGEATFGQARVGTVNLTTGSDGTAETTLRVGAYGTTDILLRAVVDALDPEEVLLSVAGPPVTTLSFTGVASEYLDGWYVSEDTQIALTAIPGIPEATTTIRFDVDQSDGVEPLTVYEGPFTLGDLVPGESGIHVLRFLAEESTGVQEALRQVVLYTTEALDGDREITNRPNPFNPVRELTRILFKPTAAGTVNITIYDLYGAIVLNHHLNAAADQTTEFAWDGRNGQGDVVANGGYICRVTGQGFDFRRKIAVVK
ncbi:MAG: FlgD immunoglobulin-like domain containing protein [bacterium]|nr:FlgD immunoglobulin-like domain containing protein [bacterium]